MAHSERKVVIEHIVSILQKYSHEPREALVKKALDLEKTVFQRTPSKDAYLEIIGKRLDTYEEHTRARISQRKAEQEAQRAQNDAAQRQQREAQERMRLQQAEMNKQRQQLREIEEQARAKQLQQQRAQEAAAREAARKAQIQAMQGLGSQSAGASQQTALATQQKTALQTQLESTIRRVETELVQLHGDVQKIRLQMSQNLDETQRVAAVRAVQARMTRMEVLNKKKQQLQNLKGLPADRQVEFLKQARLKRQMEGASGATQTVAQNASTNPVQMANGAQNGVNNKRPRVYGQAVSTASESKDIQTARPVAAEKQERAQVAEALAKLQARYRPMLKSQWQVITKELLPRQDTRKQEQFLLKLTHHRKILEINPAQVPPQFSLEYIAKVDSNLKSLFEHVRQFVERKNASQNNAGATRVGGAGATVANLQHQQSVPAAAPSRPVPESQRLSASNSASTTSTLRTELVKDKPPAAKVSQQAAVGGIFPLSDVTEMKPKAAIAVQELPKADLKPAAVEVKPKRPAPEASVQPAKSKPKIAEYLEAVDRCVARASHIAKALERERLIRYEDTVKLLGKSKVENSKVNVKQSGKDGSARDYEKLQDEFKEILLEHKNLVTEMTEEYGVAVISCGLKFATVRFPQLIIRVPRGYPKNGTPKIFFERPPLGWIGPVGQMKRTFDTAMESHNAAETGFTVRDVLEEWFKAGESVATDLTLELDTFTPK